jgi:hypothetical protein
MTMGCAATFRAKPAAQTMVTTRTQRSWYFSAPKILSCRDACGGSAPRTRRYAAVACRSGSWWACRPARRCTNSLISSRTVVPHQIVVPDTPPEGTEVPRSDRYSSWACRADLAAEAGDLGERKARRRPAPLIVALCRWCGAGLLPVGWLGLRICCSTWLARPVAHHLRVVSHVAGTSVHRSGRIMIVRPIPVRHTGENAGIGLTIIAPARGVGLVPRTRQRRSGISASPASRRPQRCPREHTVRS